jgi:hypothetical protein
MLKKLIEALLALAALSVLLAILIRYGVLPLGWLNHAPHTFLSLTQLLLLAAVALGVYGLLPAPAARSEKKE